MSTKDGTISRVLRVTWHVIIMPWPCLQSAIEQILQEDSPEEQEKSLEKWLKLKNKELMNVSFVGALILSAGTGSIQWSQLDDAHWVVSACWYATLLFSLLSVMCSFYLSILLSNFTIHTKGTELLLKSLQSRHNKKRARWGSMFALQVPLMLLSYSLIGYVVGLALLVVRPLWTQAWGNAGAVAVCFVACLACGIGVFGAVCHFIYVQNEDLLEVK